MSDECPTCGAGRNEETEALYARIATLEADLAEATKGGDAYRLAMLRAQNEVLQLRADLARVTGERDRFAALVADAQAGKLPWRDEQGNDRGRPFAEAAVYEHQVAELYAENEALGNSLVAARRDLEEAVRLLRAWMVYPSSNPTDPFCNACDDRVSKCDAAAYACTGREARAFLGRLAAHPAPEPTKGPR